MRKNPDSPQNPPNAETLATQTLQRAAALAVEEWNKDPDLLIAWEVGIMEGETVLMGCFKLRPATPLFIIALRTEKEKIGYGHLSGSFMTEKEESYSRDPQQPRSIGALLMQAETVTLRFAEEVMEAQDQ